MAIHGPGQFMGELAQLAGRPALNNARALESGEALIIPPEQLRALLIAEVELGERICAPLFYAVSICSKGRWRADHCGRVITVMLGRRPSAVMVIRMVPATLRTILQALVKLPRRLRQLPIVLCPGGQRSQPSEAELAAASDWWGQRSNRLHDPAVRGGAGGLPRRLRGLSVSALSSTAGPGG
jgi:thioredoxin reductase (NADPH)